MRAAEQAFAALSRGEALTDRESPTYFGPVARAARRLGLPVDPAMVVLGACVSSALAVGLATRWLARGSCDVALAGGFDEVTVFVAAGFEALRATTAAPPPRPFRLDRDGMSLGEGAAVLALTRPEQGAPARFFVRGFGASSDAVHLTAPERSGDGLARAAERALEEAGSPRVDLVGAHATATPFNDPAEWRAMERALGASVARAVVTHPFKAQIGHALGAAGALELLACARALEDGILPPAAGTGELDPQAPARQLDRAVVHVNALPPLDELALRVRVPVDRLARADALVHWALAAVASLRERCGPLGGAGVVVGSALATLETNGAFAARIRERGARAAEPRLFPYTSPNAVAGECSIAFGLTGPSFTVGGGMHAGIEALAAAALLVEAGDAERVVVVAADHVGALGRAMAPAPVVPGAVATLVSSAAAGARARVGAMRLRRGAPVPGSGPAGHEALLPLVAGSPRELVSVSAPDAEARIELEPV
jgi:3-oxoacyl-[acyl-carrier-protein] synthase-1/3-oxoacyl-[acyl-carrier-protein] synthase II